MEANSKSDSESHSSEENPLTKEGTNSLIFVGGLPSEACNLHLEQYFGKFGNLEMAQVRLSDTGKSKGYGFIKYSDPSQLELMLAKQPHQILDKMITVERAHDQSKKLSERISVTNRKVFITGIPASMTVEDIKSFVSKITQVLKISKPRYKSDRTQYCVAFLETVEDAEKLLSSDPIKLGKSGFKIEFSQFIPPKLQKKPQIQQKLGSLGELKYLRTPSPNKAYSMRQISQGIHPIRPFQSFTEETESIPLHQKMLQISVVQKAIRIRHRLCLQSNRINSQAFLHKQDSLEDDVGMKKPVSISPVVRDEEYRFNLKYVTKRTKSAQH